MTVDKPTITLTEEEISVKIWSLSSADWMRLEKVSRSFGSRRVPAEDLLQEAVVRALGGNKKCPAHVDVVKFLAEAIRSIAHGERDKIARKPPLVSIDSDTGGVEAMGHPDPLPTAEERLIGEEQSKHIREKIFGLFEDDATARKILEGDMAGLEATAIREQTGLGKRAYDTKRKLIRRRINGSYPNGWTPWQEATHLSATRSTG